MRIKNAPPSRLLPWEGAIQNRGIDYLYLCSSPVENTGRTPYKDSPRALMADPEKTKNKRENMHYSKMVPLLLGLFLTAYSPTLLRAQEVRLGCLDAAIRVKVEQQKRELGARGFSPYKDAMLHMHSRETTPVAVEMEKGVQYQIVYNAHRNARQMEMEILDQDRQLLDKVRQKPSENSTLYYSFTPDQSGPYLFLLRQRAKEKKLCGGFTILKKSTQEDEEE